jgi:hypothetical protein
MKKLTLEIDSLLVETFQVNPAVAELRGTVQGNSTDGVGCPKSYPYHCLTQPISRGCGRA